MTFRCRLASYLAAGSLALLALGNQALGSSPATAAQFAELRPSWPGARDGLGDMDMAHIGPWPMAIATELDDGKI